MSLYKILLAFFIFIHVNILFSLDYKLKNIRFSENRQNKSLRIVLDLTHKAPYTVFSLNNNPRLVIDLESKSEIKKFKNQSIYIKNIRTRKNEQNVMRIVFDLKYNFYIDKHFYLKKNEKNIFRLVIDLKINNDSSVVYKEKKPKKESKFIITIDAGHGGIDPGAINIGKKEKNITLVAAKELKNILEKKKFKVFLTRESDIFISLKKRRDIAKKNNSDLFISLHVDSLKKKQLEVLLYILFQKKHLIVLQLNWQKEKIR